MSAKVYPVTACSDAEKCTDYRVLVDGKEAPLCSARVSAYPFNRRWPGHQRQIEQTELVNFLLLELDGETEITVLPQRKAGEVRIRPRRLAPLATVNADGSVTIRLDRPEYFTVEVAGSGVLSVFADPKKDYGVKPDDDGVLYFGRGEHDVGRIELKSGQTLLIDEGAVVYASVSAVQAKNVRILGRGILDNSRNKERIRFACNVENNDAACNNAERDHTIDIICCENVEIDGITLRDSLVYNIETASSRNVHIQNIKIIGCWRYNSDGVHFANCIDCSLSDSFLRTYDDSICVRGYAEFEYKRWKELSQEGALFECKHIRIQNCTVWNDWGKCLQIGTETHSSEVSDVKFENCDLVHVSSSGALTVWLVDCAMVKDIEFNGIRVEYDPVQRPAKMQKSDGDTYSYVCDPDKTLPLVYCSVSRHFEYSMIQDESQLGSISGVGIRDVQLYSVQKPSFFFEGVSDKSPCEKVRLRDVCWNGEALSKEAFERFTTKNAFCYDIEME